MTRKRRAKYDISHLKSTKFSRRHFMVRSAAGIAGAAMVYYSIPFNTLFGR